MNQTAMTRRTFASIIGVAPLTIAMSTARFITPDSLNTAKFIPGDHLSGWLELISRPYWELVGYRLLVNENGSILSELYSDIGLTAFKSFALLYDSEVQLLSMHITVRGWYVRPKLRKDGPCFVGYWRPNQNDKCPCFRLTPQQNMEDIVDIQATDDLVLKEAKRYRWDFTKCR